MPELNYSDEALNVIGAFYGADKMFYVEGDDDVLFWELILEKFNRDNFKVQSLGGKEELKKYIVKIENKEIDAAAARDMDFCKLSDGYVNAGDVLVTYGHSIENTLLTVDCLSRVLKSYGGVRNVKSEKDLCENWISQSIGEIEDLVLFDAANELEGVGLSVLSDNCGRFMVGDKSIKFSLPALDALRNSLECNELLKARKNFVEAKIDVLGRTVVDILRGHFLFSIVLRFVTARVKQLGKKAGVAKESFYSSLFLVFEDSLDKKTHPHYDYYESEILRLS